MRADACSMARSLAGEAVRDNAIYITTLMAGEGYIVAGQGKVDGYLYPLACSDSASRALAASGPVQGQRGPAWWTDTAAIRRIAVGTDAGNPGSLHGPSISRAGPAERGGHLATTSACAG